MSFRYDFHPTILREYDIRGVVGKTLNEPDAYAVGRTFGTVIRQKGGSKVGICYDGRHSSPSLTDSLIKGFIDSGLIVENYGLAPTPLAYFAIYHRDMDGVVAITGSHNPPEYNGIKMALREGPVFGEMIRQFGAMAAKGDVIDGTGSVSNVNIDDAYIDRLTQDYLSFNKKPMKIAWDAGNGVVGHLLKKFTDKIPGEHILLYDDVDGDFPNHHPDPLVEKNLVELKRVVKEQNCDLGIAFDGDGDRVGAIDRNGNIMWPDQFVTLYAKDVLQRHPGAKIVLDIKCGTNASNMIKEFGGEPVLWKAGHSLIKSKMKEIGSPLGGELSGHIFFKDGFYGHDDALYCAVRLLNVIIQFGDLADLQNMFPETFTTPEMRFEVPDEDKFDMVERVKAYANSKVGKDVAVFDIDGVRLNTPYGWWLLRASNTQNALTARVEGLTAAKRDELFADLQHALKVADVPVPDDLLNSGSH
ncbi:MAG TPA: phosphomannomutase/phosphoglucomutase [Alphaproteobacteria bacterium]